MVRLRKMAIWMKTKISVQIKYQSQTKVIPKIKLSL